MAKSNEKSGERRVTKTKKNAPSKWAKFNPVNWGKSLGRYFREVYRELKRVTWPSRSEYLKSCGAVTAFVLIMMVLVFAKKVIPFVTLVTKGSRIASKIVINGLSKGSALPLTTSDVSTTNKTKKMNAKIHLKNGLFLFE